MNRPPRAAYVHVPFCRHRCGYCNFTVVAGRDDLQEALLDALEIELSALGGPCPVDTVYVGGGTPTQLTPNRLARLGQIIRRWFPLSDGGEWSVEANPLDLDDEKTDVLRSGGVTRISLGAQSFRPDKLRVLERDHRPDDIQRALSRAGPAFDSVSLDLMFAVPGESLADWLEDLHAVIHVNPNHVSTYGLTFEKGTRFWSRRLRGDLRELDDAAQRSMYEAAIDSLVAGGWEHYEVSNFARPGHRCRQNEVYWMGDEYYAAGPGAARYVQGRRETNHRSTTTYLKRVLAGQSPVAESEKLSPRERAREQLVFRLRMLDGISHREFAERTGYQVDRLAGPAVRKYLELGMLEEAAGRIRLTRDGLLVSDAMWPDFLRAD